MKPNTPNNYQRLAIRDLRSLPVRENPRLRILDYRLTNAPGMVRRARTHGHGSVLLADGYVLAFCITRIGGQWLLETERRCYDEPAVGRTTTPPLPLALLADLYRALQQRQIAAEGRAHGRSAGRN